MSEDKNGRVCDNCGKAGARIRRVSRSYGSGNALIIIENIPVIACPNCGESYLEADTLRQIDELKRGRKKKLQTRSIPVAKLV